MTIKTEIKEKLFDITFELKDNAMLRHCPELFNEWNFDKNDKLGLDVYKVTFGSDKFAWWDCSKCGSQFENQIKSKVRANKDSNCCPYCLGRKVNHTNSLAVLNPILASEWHPTLNGDLMPHDVTCYNGNKVWWKCDKNHEWKATVDNRSNGRGCACCFNKKVQVGFNDMWTSNPELAKFLANPEDGYKYTQMSNKKVDWKCLECGEIVKGKQIAQICQNGLSCPRCADGRSYPEKFMFNLLLNLNIFFDYDTTMAWSNNKRYDFYLPEHSMIIETHGEQHYEETNRKGARTLKEEQENDLYKYNLAMENGIKRYIVIDARKSNADYLQNSIINSPLSVYFNLDLIDYSQIDYESQKSLHVKALNLWNANHTVREISKIVKISEDRLDVILRGWRRVGKCNYGNNRPVLQYSLDGEIIKEWENVIIASKSLSIHPSGIRQCCNGKQKTTGGYMWEYKK